MIKGDISNAVVPCVLIVFEGALGFIDNDQVDEFNRLVASGDWKSAWECWEMSDMLMRKIWDVTIRQGLTVGIVTLIPPRKMCDDAAEALAEVLDDYRLPVNRVLARTPEEFARDIAYMPDVARVYDANQSTAGMWGSRGEYLRSVHRIGQF